MPGYKTKQEQIAVAGVADLTIRSLLDRQQFFDPFGEADRRGISSATWPLFGLLWPSGLYLATRLAARPVRAGERILEMGCGLALASLVGHRRGADVTASDCHPLAAAFLRHNLRLNGLAPMQFRYGDWGARPTQRLRHRTLGGRTVHGRFDLLIGSDLLYERDERSALAGFIGRHAAAFAEVWIVDPDRGNRPAFNRQMAALGFVRDEERLSAGAGPSSAAYKGRMLTFRRVGDVAAAPRLAAGTS
ncbi:MAG: SAM-dependent methyltransferase [Caldimonas sp.]